MTQYYKGIMLLIVIYVKTVTGVKWDEIHCHLDLEERVTEGLVPLDLMGLFPWIGVIQHDFYIGNKIRYAITGAVLIHPAYVLAPAEDIAKINRQTISNTTRFILWHSATVKHTMLVVDYVMHHDYDLEKTHATIAIVEIQPNGATIRGHPHAVLPVCLPYRGITTFGNLYVVRMTDTTGELRKEVTRVGFVEKEDCDAFYEKSELDYKLMVPTDYICAAAQEQKPACVIDGGAVLVSKKANNWILLGFGVHGPGCGAPSRFIDVNSQLEWIDIQIDAIPVSRAGEETGYILRSTSPVEVVMYPAGSAGGSAQGQCDKTRESNIIYKDSSEILITDAHNGRGYFYYGLYGAARQRSESACAANALSYYFHSPKTVYVTPCEHDDFEKLDLTDQADFSCLLVNLLSNRRSNAAMWVEHDCYRDVSGMHRGQDKRRLQCYKYFKTTAYIRFNFVFDYKATIEVKVYGTRTPEPVPPVDPWAGEMSTTTWWPTDGERHAMRWGLFVPVDAWWYWL